VVSYTVTHREEKLSAKFDARTQQKEDTAPVVIPLRNTGGRERDASVLQLFTTFYMTATPDSFNSNTKLTAGSESC
jgi:hypothetical protein